MGLRPSATAVDVRVRLRVPDRELTPLEAIAFALDVYLAAKAAGELEERRERAVAGLAAGEWP